MSNSCNYVLKCLSERSHGRVRKIMVKVVILICIVASGLLNSKVLEGSVSRRFKKSLVSFGALSHTFKTS